MNPITKEVRAKLGTKIAEIENQFPNGLIGIFQHLKIDFFCTTEEDEE